MCDGRALVGRRDVSTQCCTDDFCNYPDYTPPSEEPVTTSTAETPVPETTMVITKSTTETPEERSTELKTDEHSTTLPTTLSTSTPYCLVLVGSRNGIERGFTIKLK